MYHFAELLSPVKTALILNCPRIACRKTLLNGGTKAFIDQIAVHVTALFLYKVIVKRCFWYSVFTFFSAFFSIDSFGVHSIGFFNFVLDGSQTQGIKYFLLILQDLLRGLAFRRAS